MTLQIRIDPTNYLTAVNAAEEIGKPKQTVYRWIREKKIAFLEIDGVPFVPKEEIQKLKEAIAKEDATAS